MPKYCLRNEAMRYLIARYKVNNDDVVREIIHYASFNCTRSKEYAKLMGNPYASGCNYILDRMCKSIEKVVGENWVSYVVDMTGRDELRNSLRKCQTLRKIQTDETKIAVRIDWFKTSFAHKFK